MSKEASGDVQGIWEAWTHCGNCKQELTSALELEMNRRFWQRHRSNQDPELRYNSTRTLATCLGNNREFHATNQLVDEALVCAGKYPALLLEMNLFRAGMLIKSGEKIEALGLLQAMLPEAKVYTAHPHLYGGVMQQLTEVLLDLDRNQEAHEAATELVAFAKAHYGLEDPMTLNALYTYAQACAELDRREEAKANFEYVLSTQTRVLGREHSHTQNTWQCIQYYGFAEPSG